MKKARPFSSLVILIRVNVFIEAYPIGSDHSQNYPIWPDGTFNNLGKRSTISHLIIQCAIVLEKIDFKTILDKVVMHFT